MKTGLGTVNTSLSVLLAWLVFGGLGSSAQSVESEPLVVDEVTRDVSPALSEMAARTVNPQPEPAQLGWPSRSSSVTQAAAIASGLNFKGLGADAGWLTADTSGAAGASQYVQWVNTQFAVYDKSSGALLMGPVHESTLWNGFGGPCETNNSGDPSTQYDKAAGVWVMSHHVVPGPPYYECFAVSTTSDATGSYNRYMFQLPANYFPDYPKVGVWPDAYYISINLQNSSSGFSAVAALLCAVDRNAMHSGAPATMVCFQVPASGHDLTILPSDLDGSTPPPAGAPNYFLGLASNSLNLYQFHVDFNTPSNSTFTGPTNIPVLAFHQACGGSTCIPQHDTTNTVDSVGDRLMNRVAYRNFGSYDVIVATHSVAVASPSRTGIRWYEIRTPGGSPTVYQQGTYRPDSSYRWLGSIGMDKMGDIAVGYSVSSTSMHPAIRYAGRVPTDAKGTLEAEASIMGGTGSQQPNNRFWNDISSLSIDPIDDCTFWYTNQYYKTDSASNWSTQIASFKFSACQ